MKITKSKEWYYRAYIIVWWIAFVFCVVPTVIVGAITLPMFATNDSAMTLTGSFMLVLACAAFPILKGLLKFLKSPSAWFILWLLFGVTYGLYNIEPVTLGAMVLVFFVAAVGNTVGAVLFRVSKAFKEKWAFMSDPKTGGSV